MASSLGHRRRGALAAAAAIVLGTALLMATGADRRGTGPAAGIGPQAGATVESANRGERLVVGQFNIRRSRGREGGGDLWRTAACLTGLDLVGLNEVDGGGPLGLGGDQAVALAGMLSYAAVFAPTERRFWHAHFGNALLSREAVHGWVRLPLAYEAGPAHRNLLYARVGPTGDPVRALITHIDRREDHARQLAAALGLFLRLEPPVLLIGDLNATLEHPLLKEVLERPDVVASNGRHPPGPTPGRVGWILARGFRVLSASVCDVGASDHPRIALELERLT
jgi:endonuclease/exonuclease/phosphatase family metal-dependent hydrolase